MSTTAALPPKVAVIGAGAAGLSAARVLSREGIEPVVLEQGGHSGGVWRYVENSKTRPMYRGLRTNLPKEVMAFREKPWTGVEQSFVTHTDVANYLLAYEKDFDLTRFISFYSSVQHLTVLSNSTSDLSPPTEQWPKIHLEWTERGKPKSDAFDAVFVCNGHYEKPSVPSVPGLDCYFKGSTMHSLAYDDPSQFEGKTVLCIGGRASGSDLAREISCHARHVYISDTAFPAPVDGVPNEANKVTLVPKTIEVAPDGSFRFDNGCEVTPEVDVVIFCSGYDYSFSFIDDASNVQFKASPGERRIMPLYEQLWHAHIPSLVFVGLPHSIVPFPFFELQAEAVCAQWQNPFLPGAGERSEQAEEDAHSGEAKVMGRVQDTHFLGGAQWDYCRLMAKFSGRYNDEIESYIATNKAIYDHAGGLRKMGLPGEPDIYRSVKYERHRNQWSFEAPESFFPN